MLIYPSYMRQRNSRSRLSASRQLFEVIFDKYGAFDKLRDFVSCFGVRKSDVYASAPAMRYNVLPPLGRAHPDAPGDGFG